MRQTEQIEWVPVGEGLPKSTCECLVDVEYWRVRQADFWNSNQSFMDGEKIIPMQYVNAWAYMPHGYDAGKEQKDAD